MARATRRTRFGLPDVFLQEPKQREVRFELFTRKEKFHRRVFSLFRMN